MTNDIGMCQDGDHKGHRFFDDSIYFITIWYLIFVYIV